MDEYRSHNLESFDVKLRPFLIEISSAALGGRVIGCSDDFFASRHNLIKPEPSRSLKGQFGPNGALYDGWESRRHNPAFDWVIVLLAPPLSHLDYVDIDTSHFSGNECPASQVFALRLDPPSGSATFSAEVETDPSIARTVKLSLKDPRWEEVLPFVELGPNSRHVFELGRKAKAGVWSALMIRMIPDGGMARFRAYGRPLAPTPLPTLPPPSTAPINLLSPLLSARTVACSDANFSPPYNLLLPGRGHDMSDGWETRRSQVNRGKYAEGGSKAGMERSEWVVARLGGTGCVRWVEVDTAFHPGNYPVTCKIQAILSDEDLSADSADWTMIVDKKPLGPHRQHWFDLERSVPPMTVFSHVRLTIFPDGGLKRLRIYGHPLSPHSTAAPLLTTPSDLTLPALPLMVEAFRPYGQVIQGFSYPTSAPKEIHVNVANQGTAAKFHRLANVRHTYPDDKLTRGGPYIATVRAESQADIRNGLIVPIKTLERHAHTSQAFIPMAKSAGVWGNTGLSTGGAYVVIVALNGTDDKPDMSTLRAFLGIAAQGVSYNEGVWHHSLFTVDGPLDYVLIETQIGDGSLDDLEKYTPPSPFGSVCIPPFTAVSFSSQGGAVNNSDTPSALTRLTDLLPSLFGASPILTPTIISPYSFAPFGQVLTPYPDPTSRPSDMDVQISPDGKTTKYARLTDIVSTYPADTGAVTGIAVFRATPKIRLDRGNLFDIRFMERHQYTSQAFIPMGKGEVG